MSGIYDLISLGRISDGLVIKIKQATQQGWIEMDSGGVADLSFPTSKTRRGRVEDRGQICPTITTTGGLHRLIVNKNGTEYEIKIRKLTEVETMILMGMKAEDAEKCKAVGESKTQLYKQSGNGLVSNCVQLLMEHLYKAQYDQAYECTDERILREQAAENFTQVAN